jgi:phosphohistidine phosphatase
MGILLKQLQLVPDYIISSTAKRAVDTAKSVAEFCGYEGEINHDTLLYQASAGQYAKVLSVVPDDYHRVLIVGHNPAVEDLLEKLTNMIEMMKTCSLAQIDINAKSWRELATERNNHTLVNVWHPTAKDE